MSNQLITPDPIPNTATTPAGAEPAVDMIRDKIRNLYSAEPDAATEVTEATEHTHPGSSHQQYMRSLTASGKTLVEIQTAWHAYYLGLPDAEKYEVWQEFYVQNGSTTAAQPSVPTATETEATMPTTSTVAPEIPSRAQHRKRQAQRASASLQRAAARVKQAATTETAADVKKRIISKVKAYKDGSSTTTRQKLKAKHHLQSLLFGLGTGVVVIAVILFSFFNELLIAPLIQPSRKATNTPVIVDVASTIITGGPKVLIPKINVEIPVDYSQTTINEQQIELALDNGVVHYPTTVRPGQTGNAAYFGHSSNNIFNPGKYKFAFVLLHELEEGDTFYLTNDNKTYAYKVFSKRIVPPTEVGVLGPVAGHASTATLITCDPPGTSINRLVVVGDQISPDAAGNPVTDSPAVETATSTPTSDLPGNGPSLWSRMWAAVF